MVAAIRPGPGLGARPGTPAKPPRRRRRWLLGTATSAAVVFLLAGALTARADPNPTPAPAPSTATSAPPAATPSAAPTPAPTSCAPGDCIPQPSSPTPTQTPDPGATSPPPDVSGDGTSGISGWIADGIDAAINAIFTTIIVAALNPLLELLSDTLLTTPSLSSLPRVGELWNNSWQIVLACYGILIILAGIVLMGYESVQSRYTVKEIAPRLVVGFLASGLSLFLAGKAVDLANALSYAVMYGGADSYTAGDSLRGFVVGSFAISGDFFIDIMWMVVIAVLVVLLVTYVVRVAMTVILVAGAPLALMCHALPQTDGIARWWWKAFGGVLAIQIAQSLTLITGVQVFLAPGGFASNGLFGGTTSGLINLLVTLALMYILVKIPFWILGSLRFSNRRSFVGSAVRAYAMYRTLGLLRGAGGSTAGAARGGRRRPPASGGGGTPRPPGSGGSGPPPATLRPPRGATTASAVPGSARRQPPGPPLFLAPGQASPDPPQPTGRADGPPPMPTFRAPGEPSETPARRPPARPDRPPGQPLFLAPGNAQTQHRPGAVRPRSAPGLPRFQQANPQPVVPARRATRPPAPAIFRAPVPEPRPPAPQRSPGHAPPQATFSSPQPRATPGPPPPRRRSRSTPPSRPSGGDVR